MPGRMLKPYEEEFLTLRRAVDEFIAQHKYSIAYDTESKDYTLYQTESHGDGTASSLFEKHNLTYAEAASLALDRIHNSSLEIK